MPDLLSYDYAVIRLVPKVERDEFINVGVILFCRDADFAEARVDLDETRALALDADLDLEAVRAHLAAIPQVMAGGEAAGPLGALSTRERFLMLAAPRSTIIQPSPVHTGLCRDPGATLARLMASLVRTG